MGEVGRGGGEEMEAQVGAQSGEVFGGELSLDSLDEFGLGDVEPGEAGRESRG